MTILTREGQTTTVDKPQDGPRDVESKAGQPQPPDLCYPRPVPTAKVEPHVRRARQESFLLGTLRDGRLRVQSPLKIRLSREREHFVAEATEIKEFGFGQSATEALRDLQHAMVELYFTLEQEQGRLGSDLKRTWDILQNKVKKTVPQ